MEQETDIIIKTVSENDFESYGILRHKLWPQDTIDEHVSEISALYSEQNYIALIALLNNQPVGFAEASMRPYVNGCLYRPVGFLEGIWVEPQFQRRGVGGALVQFCEMWSKENGAKELGSDAYLENKISHLSHQNWGFEMTEKVVYFRKKLSD